VTNEAYVPHTEQPAGIQRRKAWHEMLADYILLNPTATHEVIAEAFKVHVNTVGNVLRSDLFKMYFEQRKVSFQDQVNGTAIERLTGKVARLAEVGVDALTEKIEKEREVLGLDALTETSEMALKALGYSPKSIINKTVNNTQVAVVDAGLLQAARQRIAEQREPASGEAGGMIPQSPPASSPNVIHGEILPPEEE
jgi:hypothetical protein